MPTVLQTAPFGHSGNLPGPPSVAAEKRIADYTTGCDIQPSGVTTQTVPV